ncbi:MAG: hypothetical protein V4732_14480 [Pseudomonadota bacterium]
MAEIILYLTESDAKIIIDWVNADSDIAWIVKDSQIGNTYRWKAVNELHSVESKSYCLWFIGSGPLRIPSGSVNVKDVLVLNPFVGWEQTLKHELAEVPWFGAAAPETFHFTFREFSKRNEHAIGRSGFNWIGNYFSVVGTVAPPECKKWWEKLKRFVKKNSVGVPWPGELGSGKVGAYAFPCAYKKLVEGCEKDVNP